MVTSVSASMMIDAASHSHSHTYPHSHSHSNSHSYPHSHSHSNEHANRAPTRSDRPWRKSASHRNADHDAATATYAAQRRQSRLDFQTERLGSPAEQRVEGGSLNQRMMEGRGDAMDHSSEPRLDTSGSQVAGRKVRDEATARLREADLQLGADRRDTAHPPPPA
ncbi:unnamed protein product [Closterium sp. NIES-54]